MKRLALTAVLLLFIIVNVFSQANPLNIKIVRDAYGVPHIFATTDEEVAYGLAWAQSEDDFKTIQELLLAIRGKLGSVNGKDGAILDFMAKVSGVDRVVEEQFDGAFSPKFQLILDYFAQGLNDYAEAYPKEVLRNDLFPVDSKDLVKSYTLTMTFLTSVYTEIQKIMNGWITNYEGNLPDGSNAFAFNSSRTVDGKTYLAVNSHQPLQGLFSWYEAHVCSEEGWNFLGGTFPGGAVIFLGTNPHLGWANTLNHPDLCDVYKLEMNPDNNMQYKFDGKWEELEEIKFKMKVKVGFLKIPIKKKLYWSKYGSTIKTKHGVYALRFPANMEIRAPEQLYMMNKATSYEEFMAAMNMQTQAGVNTIYADRQDNIYFLSNGLFPERKPGYDWLGVLPGNTSETLWEPDFYPLEDLPQILNPSSGYLYNTNNSPFSATGDADNIPIDSINPSFNYLWEENNRSLRAKYLISQFDGKKLTYDDFKQIKYDDKFNENMYTYSCEGLHVFFTLTVEEYPDLKESIEALQDWNMSADVDNKEATILLFAMNNIIDKIRDRGTAYECNAFGKEEYVEALRKAQKHMLKHFGKIRVPLGEAQKLVRGDVELPIGGAPDVIAASMSSDYKDGMLKVDVGDSYIMLLKYSKDSVEIETVHAYGSSANPDSPHYTDQMEMFVNHEYKKMTLDKHEVFAKAKKIYHPIKGQPKPDDVLLGKQHKNEK